MVVKLMKFGEMQIHPEHILSLVFLSGQHSKQPAGRMDTVRSFKDYGKVDEGENRNFQRGTCRLLLIISVTAILLAVIIIGIVTGVGDDNDTKISPSSATNSIKIMCSVTKHPGSCFSSVSTSMKGTAKLTTDPEELLKLSLRVASEAVAKVLKTFTIPTNDKRLESGFKDCKGLFDNAAHRLNDSIASLGSKDSSGGKMLTVNLKSWLGAAITDMETCLHGFKGTTGDFGTEMESLTANSKKFTSNSLAIVGGILDILPKLDFSLHRKLLTAADS